MALAPGGTKKNLKLMLSLIKEHFIKISTLSSNSVSYSIQRSEFYFILALCALVLKLI